MIFIWFFCRNYDIIILTVDRANLHSYMLKNKGDYYMLSFENLTFIVLDVSISIWSILISFAIVAIMTIIIYILIFLKKSKKTFFNSQEVDNIEFKRLEKFETLRNDFEVELGKIKKIRKLKK